MLDAVLARAKPTDQKVLDASKETMKRRQEIKQRNGSGDGDNNSNYGIHPSYWD